MERKRFSVTLTKSFIDGIEELVGKGIFQDPQDTIRESLRDTFEKYGIDPFIGGTEG